MAKLKAEEQAKQALKLASSIGDLLQGHDSGVMGAALAEVVSKWMAGHHPDIRGDIIQDFSNVTMQLVPVNHAILVSRFGGEWPTKTAFAEAMSKPAQEPGQSGPVA